MRDRVGCCLQLAYRWHFAPFELVPQVACGAPLCRPSESRPRGCALPLLAVAYLVSSAALGGPLGISMIVLDRWEISYALSQYGEDCIRWISSDLAMVLPNEMIVLRDEMRRDEIAWSMTVTAVVQPSQHPSLVVIQIFQTYSTACHGETRATPLPSRTVRSACLTRERG